MSHECFFKQRVMTKGCVYENKSGGKRSQEGMRVLTLTWVPHGWGCCRQPGNMHWVFVITVNTGLDVTEPVLFLT